MKEKFFQYKEHRKKHKNDTISFSQFYICNLFSIPLPINKKTVRSIRFGRFLLRGMGGNRTHGEAFAEPCLTTWLPRRNLKFIKQSYIVSLIKQKIKTPPEIFYYFKSEFVFHLSGILFWDILKNLCKVRL